MRIESISHKGLCRFFETGIPKGLVGDPARIGKMLAFIAASVEDLRVPPNYGLHDFAGDRTGAWAMTVTRNWRMTFRINDHGLLGDMDLEDYHGA